MASGGGYDLDRLMVSVAALVPETSLTTRPNYIFSPDLSLQVYAQPLFGTGDYDGMMPRAAEFSECFHVFTEDQIQFLDQEDHVGYVVDRDLEGGVGDIFDNPFQPGLKPV